MCCVCVCILYRVYASLNCCEKCVLSILCMCERVCAWEEGSEGVILVFTLLAKSITPKMLACQAFSLPALG